MKDADTIDLDELAARCRNDSARKYIGEAVACYKVGAYRACIVSTWIGVIADILHKLGDLRLTGDRAAEAALKAFEQRQIDPKGFVGLEVDILNTAKNLEFISTIEHAELERIYQDRNKSAHPSVSDPEDVYEPAAELARTAMRTAVSHLLQHPPVQGKAALENIVTAVKSVYFPVVPDDAIRAFSTGPLSHPRNSLVRNLVIRLLKEYLGASSGQDESRFLAAINAIDTMHKQVSRETLDQKLSQIFSTVADTDFYKVVGFLATVPDCWQHLEDSLRIKLKRCIGEVAPPELALTVTRALRVPELNEVVVARVRTLTEADLASLIASEPNAVFLERALELYSSSGSYAEANDRGAKLIAPMLQYFNATNVEALLWSARQNSQIRDSHEYEKVKRNIVSSQIMSQQDLEQLQSKIDQEYQSS